MCLKNLFLIVTSVLYITTPIQVHAASFTELLKQKMQEYYANDDYKKPDTKHYACNSTSPERKFRGTSNFYWNIVITYYGTTSDYNVAYYEWGISLDLDHDSPLGTSGTGSIQQNNGRKYLAVAEGDELDCQMDGNGKIKYSLIKDVNGQPLPCDNKLKWLTFDHDTADKDAYILDLHFINQFIPSEKFICKEVTLSPTPEDPNSAL